MIFPKETSETKDKKKSIQTFFNLPYRKTLFYLESLFQWKISKMPPIFKKVKHKLNKKYDFNDFTYKKSFYL